MRILISGGTGMIGKQLVARLQESGHELWILTRSVNKGHSLPRVKMIHWDGSSLGQWSELVNQVDAIINLAGENIGSKRWSVKRKNLIIDSRVNAGEILTEAITNAKKRPNVFIQASAIGFYDKKNSEIMSEDSTISNDFLGNICKKWEESSLKVETMGIRRVVIRTGVVLAKEDGALNRMLIPFNFFLGGPIGNGKQMVSWIHQSDEISAIQFLLENEKAKGVYNLTAPYPTTNANLGKNLAKITKRPYWIPVPAFILQFFLGEMSSLVLDGQTVSSKKLIDAGFSFKFEKIEDALINIMA